MCVKINAIYFAENTQNIAKNLRQNSTKSDILLNIFGSLAEFERDTIRERTKAGLSAAKARGRMGGKKKGLSPEAMKKAETAVMLYKQKKSAVEIAGIIGVGRATVYRYLDEMGQERNLQSADNQ